MDAAHVALVAGAALGAGAVNAIAGGGSLLTFPALVAAGLPTVTASVTNTVALCPGYLGATWAQRRELAGQGRRLGMLGPVSAVGGLAGGLLLLDQGSDTSCTSCRTTPSARRTAPDDRGLSPHRPAAIT